MAEKKKKKKENGASKTNTVKAQLKPERKKIRKKPLRSAQREENLKEITDVMCFCCNCTNIDVFIIYFDPTVFYIIHLWSTCASESGGRGGGVCRWRR